MQIYFTSSVLLLLQEFFLNVKDALRRTAASGPAAFVKWTPDEVQLNDKYHDCVQCVHEALCGEYHQLAPQTAEMTLSPSPLYDADGKRYSQKKF